MPAPDFTFETRINHLEDWLNALPYANFQRTMEMMAYALDQTNRQALRPQLRFELIKLYLHPYFYLLDTHIKQKPQTDLQNVKQARERSDQLRAVSATLAIAAKITLQDALKEKSSARQQELVCGALLLGIRTLSNLLLLNFFSYVTVPEAVWSELHQFYAQAEKLGCHTVPLDDPEADNQHVTIAAAYAQILAAAVVDPNHLSHHLIWRIYDLLQTLRRDIVFGPFKMVENPAGHFVVNLGGSKPRRYRDFDAAEASSFHRLLDCSALPKNIALLIEKSALQNSRIDLPVNVLADLEKAWGLAPKRLFPRQHQNLNPTVAFGMNASYFVVNEYREFSTAEVPDYPDLDNYEAGLDTQGDRYFICKWSILNASKKGKLLYLASPSKRTIRVGELAVVSADEGHSWEIGVVRWLQLMERKSHKLGLEILADAAQAVAIRALHGNAIETEFRRALLIRFDNREPALLSAGGLFAGHRLLELVSTTDRIQLTAGELIERTIAFELFTVQR